VSFLDIDLFEVFTNIGGNFHEGIVSWGGKGFKGLLGFVLDIDFSI